MGQLDDLVYDGEWELVGLTWRPVLLPPPDAIEAARRLFRQTPQQRLDECSRERTA